jgi:benzoyl-CoA reductase/2-hydroxyglutaryl-CoA dehydratase subunit BcrC/BadD/HgdB
MHYYNNKKYNQEPTSWHLLFREIGKLGLEAYRSDRKVIWTTAYAFPLELLRPLELVPIDFELHAGLFSSFGFTDQALRAADRIGVPMDSCTVHRVAAGATTLNRLPKPDFLVSTTHYCDGKPKTNELIQDLYGVEYFLVDVPQKKDEPARRYLEDQLRHAYQKLCDIAGVSYDEERLIEPVRHLNETTRLLRQVEALRQQRPSPYLPENRGFSLTFFAKLLYGTAELNDVYRLLIQELENTGKGVDKNERYRFLWLMASPTYPQNIFETLESYGIRIVAEEMGLVYWKELDEIDPLGSMATRMLDNPFLGSIQQRIDLMKQTIRKFEVDGVVHFCHIPCRQANVALWLLKEAAEEMGVRFINLEADITDPSSFSPEKTKSQIMANMEILNDRS